MMGHSSKKRRSQQQPPSKSSRMKQDSPPPAQETPVLPDSVTPVQPNLVPPVQEKEQEQEQAVTPAAGAPVQPNLVPPVQEKEQDQEQEQAVTPGTPGTPGTPEQAPEPEQDTPEQEQDTPEQEQEQDHGQVDENDDMEEDEEATDIVLIRYKQFPYLEMKINAGVEELSVEWEANMYKDPFTKVNSKKVHNFIQHNKNLLDYKTWDVDYKEGTDTTFNIADQPIKLRTPSGFTFNFPSEPGPIKVKNFMMVVVAMLHICASFASDLIQTPLGEDIDLDSRFEAILSAIFVTLYHVNTANLHPINVHPHVKKMIYGIFPDSQAVIELLDLISAKLPWFEADMFITTTVPVSMCLICFLNPGLINNLKLFNVTNIRRFTRGYRVTRVNVANNDKDDEEKISDDMSLSEGEWTTFQEKVQKICPDLNMNPDQEAARTATLIKHQYEVSTDMFTPVFGSVGNYDALQTTASSCLTAFAVILTEKAKELGNPQSLDNGAACASKSCKEQKDSLTAQLKTLRAENKKLKKHSDDQARTIKVQNATIKELTKLRTKGSDSEDEENADTSDADKGTYDLGGEDSE